MVQLKLRSRDEESVKTKKKQSEKYVINCVAFIRFWGRTCTLQSERTVLNDRTTTDLRLVHLKRTYPTKCMVGTPSAIFFKV